MRPDIGFYVQAAREYGGPVLELGCGTGRILVPTARVGVDIAGPDASERMLAVCRASLDAEPPEVRRRAGLHHGDIRGFDLGRRFRLITLPLRPFQYLLTVEEQLACLSAIRRHLEPDGRLVFDLLNPSVHYLARPLDPAEADEEPPFTHSDGRTVLRRNRIVERDLPGQTFAGELVYDATHPDGRTEHLVHQYRLRSHLRRAARRELNPMPADRRVGRMAGYRSPGRRAGDEKSRNCGRCARGKRMLKHSAIVALSVWAVCCTSAQAEESADGKITASALREARDIMSRDLFGHYDVTNLVVLKIEDFEGRVSSPRDYGLVRVTLEFSAKRNATRHPSLNARMFEPGSAMCQGWLYLHCGVPIGHVFEGKLELLLAVDGVGSWRAVSPRWRSRSGYPLDGYLLLEERGKEGYLTDADRS